MNALATSVPLAAVAAATRRDVLARKWAGHPRGSYLVAFTELWERFSYWGLAGLLVLYLTASPSTGGWGWNNADAVRLYAWYGGLAFALPVVGAWLANNYLGERRCILWGCCGIVLGHLMLAAPVLAPWLCELLTPASADPALLAQGKRVGQWVFLAGLLFIAGGTGLMKPTISSILAQLYPNGGTRRDEGFAYFFVAIYVGALLGALIPGFLGERVGWHYGLGAAAAGMLVALATYLALQNHWLADIGRAPLRRAVAGKRPLTREERHRIYVILVQGAFTIAYATGFYQMYGLLNLYAHQEIDRHIGTFEVPTTWMQTICLVSFFIYVPLLAWLWRRLSRHSCNPSASYKLALGLAVMAAGYLILMVAEADRESAKPPLLWLACTYLLFGLGDAFVWANQVSLTSKLAPERYSAFFIGAWYLCIGIGTWLTGYIGAWAQERPFVTTFGWLAAGCALAAILLALLTPFLRDYMHGAEDENIPGEIR